MVPIAANMINMQTQYSEIKKNLRASGLGPGYNGDNFGCHNKITV
jgi:hypothetical protein